MRHRIAGKQLNVNSNHRRAMLRNLAAGLFEHGRIETTMAKAKAVQPFVERLITLALKGDLSARRRLVSRLTDRRIFAWVADPNVPDERKSNPYFDPPVLEEARREVAEHGATVVAVDVELLASDTVTHRSNSSAGAGTKGRIRKACAAVRPRRSPRAAGCP